MAYLVLEFYYVLSTIRGHLMMGDGMKNWNQGVFLVFFLINHKNKVHQVIQLQEKQSYINHRFIYSQLTSALATKQSKGQKLTSILHDCNKRHVPTLAWLISACSTWRRSWAWDVLRIAAWVYVEDSADPFWCVVVYEAQSRPTHRDWETSASAAWLLQCGLKSRSKHDWHEGRTVDKIKACDSYV